MIRRKMLKGLLGAGVSLVIVEKGKEAEAFPLTHWTPDNAPCSFQIWLNGQVVHPAAELLGSPEMGVEVQGAVRLFVLDEKGQWMINDAGDEAVKEWRSGLVRWEKYDGPVRKFRCR